MIGQSDNTARREYLTAGIFDPLSGALVDDSEHLLNRAAFRFGALPARQVLSNWIHQQDETFSVGGDHRVADAVESHSQPFASRQSQLSGSVQRFANSGKEGSDGEEGDQTNRLAR